MGAVPPRWVLPLRAENRDGNEPPAGSETGELFLNDYVRQIVRQDRTEAVILDDSCGPEKALGAVDIMWERFLCMGPQDKDRLLQIHLAQARGPSRNARLLFDMTEMLLRARRINQGRKERDGDESNL